MMPKIDGFEVCRRLKGDTTLGLVPIIMVTARIDSKDVVTGSLTLLLAASVRRMRWSAEYVGWAALRKVQKNLGVWAHARRLKQRPDIGAAVTAGRAHELRFKIEQPHIAK